MLFSTALVWILHQTTSPWGLHLVQQGFFHCLQPLWRCTIICVFFCVSSCIACLSLQAYSVISPVFPFLHCFVSLASPSYLLLLSSFTSPHFTWLLTPLLLYLPLWPLTHFPLHFSSAVVFPVSSRFQPFLSLFSQRCHILFGFSCAVGPYRPSLSWLETAVPSTGYALFPILQLPKTSTIYATYNF